MGEGQCRAWGPSIPCQSSPTSHLRLSILVSGVRFIPPGPLSKKWETGFLSLPHLTSPGV